MANLKDIVATLAILSAGSLALTGCKKEGETTNPDEVKADDGGEAADGGAADGEGGDGEGSCGADGAGGDGEGSCGADGAADGGGEGEGEATCSGAN